VLTAKLGTVLGRGRTSYSRLDWEAPLERGASFAFTAFERVGKSTVLARQRVVLRDTKEYRIEYEYNVKDSITETVTTRLCHLLIMLPQHCLTS